MPQVLQKIRKVAKRERAGHSYATYAFGELLLVIVGILVSLQINN